MNSGYLNFLEPSGPLQACNGTAAAADDDDNDNDNNNNQNMKVYSRAKALKNMIRFYKLNIVTSIFNLMLI
jgi:hypothetical protein